MAGLLCVETAHTADHPVRLAAGDRQVLSARLHGEPRLTAA
jgi:hypothetical protein